VIVSVPESFPKMPVPERGRCRPRRTTCSTPG
jgi:hypothetical protein